MNLEQKVLKIIRARIVIQNQGTGDVLAAKECSAIIPNEFISIIVEYQKLLNEAKKAKTIDSTLITSINDVVKCCEQAIEKYNTQMK
jgi:hypothetical protein